MIHNQDRSGWFGASDTARIMGNWNTQTFARWWGEKLGKTTMMARQVSARGGDLRCQWQGDRVLISGQATTYMRGTVYLRG